MTEASAREVRRLRFQADLNELHAHGLVKGGLSGAGDKEQEANLRRGIADLIEKFETQRVAYLVEIDKAKVVQANNPELTLAECVQNPKVVMDYKATQDELVEVRRAWRETDQYFNGAQGRTVKSVEFAELIGISPESVPLIPVRRQIAITPSELEPEDLR